MKIKKWLLINWEKEKIAVALTLWLFSFLLHNFLEGVSPILSGFFFIISIFVIPLYLISAILYSLFK